MSHSYVCTAVNHALAHHEAAVVSRDGELVAVVFPDLLLLELIANGTPLADGPVILRADGRSARVVSSHVNLT